MAEQELGAVTSFYLGQVGQTANAMTAFALAQNVGATFTILSSTLVREQVLGAPSWIIYLAMFIGCCLYVAIIVYCRKTELDLLGPQCAQRRITKGLAIARVTCIILSIAPVVLAVLAVKNHPLVN